MSQSEFSRDLPYNEYQAAVGSNNSSLSNPFATILDLSNISIEGGGGTQLLTGGASWSGTGMIFDVTVLTYQIEGVNYSSVATTVTLLVGDPTNPRFDAIIVDEFSVVSVISGTPSNNPVTPTIPGDQVLVQYILVGAGQVVPTISDLFVYRESQSGDWVGSAIGSAPQPTAVFNSPTPSPFAGTACLLASYSNYSNARFIQFIAPTPISRATYVGLSLRVYLLQNLSGVTGRKPFVSLQGPGGVVLGGRYLAAHGLNLSLVGVWQQVTIPTALFGTNLATLTINSLQLSLIPTNSVFGPNLPYVDIAYDNIVFQTGFGTASVLPTIDIAQNGTTVGDTSKLNFIDGTNTTVTVTDDILNNKVDARIDISYFIPPIEQSEIRRGIIAVSGITNTGILGAINATLTGSAVAVSFGGTVPLPKLRLLTTTGSTNSTVGVNTISSNIVYIVGQGFRFIGSYIYSDQSSGGTNHFVPNARQFCGLATGLSLLNISSTNTVETRTNLIGIGSDSTDTNLHIFHNDGSGNCTKLDLGSNFPANKTGAVANTEVYQLEMYNVFGSTDVKYRVSRLSDGVEVTGTINSNIPSGAVDLGPQIVRTSGATSQNVSIDLVQLTTYTRA